MAKQYDLILFGATSFIGKLVIEYYWSLTDNSFSWAVAGRNKDKFVQFCQQSGRDVSDLTFIYADSNDFESLLALCRQTKVVISTVGPYAWYGEAMLKACVDEGVDYCDLTGEPQWIKKMLARYGQAAKETGARIVNCCGFDSIPSDLGVYYLQKCSQSAFSRPCNRVSMRVKAIRGGMSGGTVASLSNIIKASKSDPSLRQALRDPYALSESDPIRKVQQPALNYSAYDKQHRAWVAPFIMAAINVKVVLRSHSLAPNLYGQSFIYHEALLVGRGFKGWLRSRAFKIGIPLFVLLMMLKPTRLIFERFLLPKPGEGPSPEAQEKGFYDLRFTGSTENDDQISIKVTGDRDPGYGSTAKILGQAALCLAQDLAPNTSGGFWTPAALMADKLMARLSNYAGLAFIRL